MQSMNNEVEVAWKVSGESPQSREACGRHGVSLAGGIPHSIATPSRDLWLHAFLYNNPRGTVYWT